MNNFEQLDIEQEEQKWKVQNEIVTMKSNLSKSV